jgi:hypothetical protein
MSLGFAAVPSGGYRRGMSRPAWWIARALALALILVIAACPKPTRRTLVPQVPTTGDATARQRFLAVREEFLRDGGHAEEFTAIADAYAGDPVEPFALLYAGVAAQRAGAAATAATSLQKLLALPDVEPGLRTRGQLYLGLATSYLGDAAGALPLLAAGEGAIEDDRERGEWLAAQVHAHLGSTTPLAALPWMDRFWKLATEAERGYLIARGAEVVAAADDAAIAAAWAAAGEGRVAVALLADRVAATRAAAGDRDLATRARGLGADARRALGLPDVGGDVAPADAGPVAVGRLGAIVAQSGKQARVGAQIVAGLHVGAASVGAGAPAIAIVDAEGGAAADAVASLAGGDSLAIIGPADAASVDAASARAGDVGVPLLSLSPRPEERKGGGRWVFHLMHSAEARARALARRAHAAGVRRFAILRPDSGYGTAVGRAFAAEVAALGDELVVEVTYKPDTKSFAGIVKKLDGSWQAVFVPEAADKVELVAPALAAAGLIARPAGTKKVSGGRPIVLLSTLEGAGEPYVREAGRYSAGALFAPGYFPGAVDDLGLAFERQYLAAIGKPPTAVDAYAFDGVRAIAALVAAGARGRDDLARRLGSAQLDGVTGAIGFDADHRRKDDGVIYTVEVDGGSVTVRAVR